MRSAYRFEASLTAAEREAHRAAVACGLLQRDVASAEAALAQLQAEVVRVGTGRADDVTTRIDADRWAAVVRDRKSIATADLNQIRSRAGGALARYLQAKRRADAFVRHRERARERFAFVRARRDEAERAEASAVAQIGHEGRPRRD